MASEMESRIEILTGDITKLRCRRDSQRGKQLIAGRFVMDASLGDRSDGP
jgi:hypothetical protein